MKIAKPVSLLVFARFVFVGALFCRIAAEDHSLDEIAQAYQIEFNFREQKLFYNFSLAFRKITTPYT